MGRSVNTRPKLSLWVEGLGRLQISSFSADFSRNQIPNATCLLAVGRNASSGKAAKIHSELSNLERAAKAKVYFRGYGDWDRKTEWPDTEQVIFEGRILGVSLQKAGGKLNLAIFLTHWLADLDYSSTLSSQSHPNNPASLTFSATVGSLVRSGAVTVNAGMAQTAEARSITMANVRDDLWGKAIKPMLCSLAGEKHVKFKGAVSDCLGPAEGNNRQALAALARIEGVVADDAGCSLDLSCYTPKLSMDLGEAVPESVAVAIAQAIRQESINSFAQTTFWGKLAGGYAAFFMFSVIPLVDRALVVPFIPGLRSTYCKEIKADDYAYIDARGELTRPLRAVGVVAGRGLSTGILSGARGGEAILGLGGCFAPEDIDASEGLLHCVQAPIWLSGLFDVGFSAARTTGLKDRLGTASTTTPVALAQARLRGAAGGKPKEDIIRDVSSLFNGYAHAVYVSESLRSRLAVVSGKLRFDIAPGSTVKLAGSVERFLGGADALGQELIGSVARVSLGIDAESGQAGTAFQLDCVRTTQENQQDATSLDLHPLYRTKFLGAPLVDDLQFANKDCC